MTSDVPLRRKGGLQMRVARCVASAAERPRHPLIKGGMMASDNACLPALGDLTLNDEPPAARRPLLAQVACTFDWVCVHGAWPQRDTGTSHRGYVCARACMVCFSDNCLVRRAGGIPNLRVAHKRRTTTSNGGRGAGVHTYRCQLAPQASARGAPCEKEGGEPRAHLTTTRKPGRAS